jgi:hypothetical protein
VTPDPFPPPPTAPHEQSCCGRHCEPCIFDYYDAAFTAWENEIRARGLAPADVLASLGQQRAQRPKRSEF